MAWNVARDGSLVKRNGSSKQQGDVMLHQHRTTALFTRGAVGVAVSNTACNAFGARWAARGASRTADGARGGAAAPSILGRVRQAAAGSVARTGSPRSPTLEGERRPARTWRGIGQHVGEEEQPHFTVRQGSIRSFSSFSFNEVLPALREPVAGRLPHNSDRGQEAVGRVDVAKLECELDELVKFSVLLLERLLRAPECLRAPLVSRCGLTWPAVIGGPCRGSPRGRSSRGIYQ
jgi:hypothetical protein